MKTSIPEDKNSVDEVDSKLDTAVERICEQGERSVRKSLPWSMEGYKIVTYNEQCKRSVQHIVKKAVVHLIGVAEEEEERESGAEEAIFE